MEHFHGFVVVLLTYILGIQGRAVNISNTWVLPEEGFPVFYRYFRDRISWYEADAVCQFHHGNLVTVDTTSQFDAVRAYLKELDIVTNVWIGLTRPSDKITFSWNGERQLTGDGFWAEASAAPGVAVCAAADPAADFRWHALTCGGPEVASFICELPVPPWATGANGCMLTSLPSLTVIYLPEQTAVELTSDCGLDGTKRIACKGKTDQQEMMRQLSCGITHDDFDDKAVSKSPSQSTTQDTSSNSVNIELSSSISSRTSTAQKAATKPWIWTSNTIDTGEYGSPTRHRRETEDTYSTAGGISLSTTDITARKRASNVMATKLPYYPTTRSNFEMPSTTAMSTNIQSDRYTSSSSAAATTTERFIVTTSNPMPETTRQRPSSKSPEPLTTLKPSVPINKATNNPELTTSVPSSTDATSFDTPSGEFPSINQGQLFSIIENGTMFDIIEVNDTSETESDSKVEKTTAGVKINPHETTKLYVSTLKPLITTTNYQTTQEPQMIKAVKTSSDSNSVPMDKTAGNSKHYKSPNDLLDTQDEKTFMKAIEAFPSDASSLIKLNRTNRKELPLVDFSFNSTEEYSTTGTNNKQNSTDFKDIDKDFTITTPESEVTDKKQPYDDDNHEHKIVEITITDIDRKSDATKLYVTTKKYDKSKGGKKPVEKTKEKLVDNSKSINIYPTEKTVDHVKEELTGKNLTADININIEISEMPAENITESNGALDESVQITIDSKLGDLNNKNNTKPVNTNSEDITGLVLVKNQSNAKVPTKQVSVLANEDEYEPENDNQEPKEQENGAGGENKDEITTEEPLEPIPEAQPRPNRNRVLTRPQRRSFYPYFFSRVLG